MLTKAGLVRSLLLQTNFFIYKKPHKSVITDATLNRSSRV